METQKIIVSGYGGQGVLTLGILIAELAMKKGKYVSWIPSYGAEMRGGTANCAVIISEKEISSPLVFSDANILVAMNNPSVDKFKNHINENSVSILNSSLVTKQMEKGQNVLIDATNLSVKLGNPKVQNMLILGVVSQILNMFDKEDINEVLNNKFAGKKSALIPLNMQAIEIGIEAYQTSLNKS
jgi:2-oxoglutarate ferredoxin oxidoreductase subunit gamma